MSDNEHMYLYILAYVSVYGVVPVLLNACVFVETKVLIVFRHIDSFFIHSSIYVMAGG